MTVTTHPTFWREGESFLTGSEAKREGLAAYVEWTLTPASERTVQTKTAFAEEWGVTLQTLRNWTREPVFQRELAERARAIARVDRVPSIMDTLYNQATDPENPRSVAAAKTILDWLDKTSSVREVDVDLTGLTDEDLVATALEMLQRVNKKES